MQDGATGKKEPSIMCKCGGHGSPEIIDPCIRELVDCLNRHGVETLASCCGHGEHGDIILGDAAIVPNIVASGDQRGWRLILAPKPIVLPYNSDTGEWEDDYPTGGMSWYGRYPGAPTHG